VVAAAPCGPSLFEHTGFCKQGGPVLGGASGWAAPDQVRGGADRSAIVPTAACPLREVQRQKAAEIGHQNLMSAGPRASPKPHRYPVRVARHPAQSLVRSDHSSFLPQRMSRHAAA
jgi:hypothetical protein